MAYSSKFLGCILLSLYSSITYAATVPTCGGPSTGKLDAFLNSPCAPGSGGYAFFPKCSNQCLCLNSSGWSALSMSYALRDDVLKTKAISISSSTASSAQDCRDQCTKNPQACQTKSSSVTVTCSCTSTAGAGSRTFGPKNFTGNDVNVWKTLRGSGASSWEVCQRVFYSEASKWNLPAPPVCKISEK